jgi:NAD(P)H-quinone oxidoreductase subunit 2
LLSLGGIPPLAGFFGKLYLFWAGWQAGAYGLVLLGLITSVVSIYYYIRVIKMMVVKEPQDMSVVIQNYPAIVWKPLGMRPLQIGLVLTLIATSLAGVLSNPVLTLVNSSVADVPLFDQAALPSPTISIAVNASTLPRTLSDEVQMMSASTQR